MKGLLTVASTSITRYDGGVGVMVGWVSWSTGKCPLANTTQYSRYTRFPANIHFYCVKKAPKGRVVTFIFHLGTAIEKRAMF